MPLCVALVAGIRLGGSLWTRREVGLSLLVGGPCDHRRAAPRCCPPCRFSRRGLWLFGAGAVGAVATPPPRGNGQTKQIAPPLSSSPPASIWEAEGGCRAGSVLRRGEAGHAVGRIEADPDEM